MSAGPSREAGAPGGQPVVHGMPIASGMPIIEDASTGGALLSGGGSAGEDPEGGGSEDGRPNRPQWSGAHPDDPRADVPPRGPERRADAEGAALMRVRRQRLLVLLVLLPVSIVLAAILGGLWIAGQFLVDAVLGAYLVYLRRSAQTARRLAAARAAVDRRIEAERAARRRRPPIGSSFAYRQRQPGPDPLAERVGQQPVEELTDEELAIAGAETIDLGALVAGQPGLDEDAEGDDLARFAGYPETGYGETGVDGVDGVAGVDGGDVASARPAIRPAPRVGTRSTTSRPGRVQVNPPGTHGGLVAPAGIMPSGTATPAGPTADASPAGGNIVGDTSGELDPLLRRHAVGS